MQTHANIVKRLLPLYQGLYQKLRLQLGYYSKNQRCERQDEVTIRAAIAVRELFRAITNEYETLSNGRTKP